MPSSSTGAPDNERLTAILDPIVEVARRAGGSARRVTVFGEMAPQLCARRQDAAAFALEQMADAYAASRQLSLVCGYCGDRPERIRRALGADLRRALRDRPRRRARLTVRVGLAGADYCRL